MKHFIAVIIFLTFCGNTTFSSEIALSLSKFQLSSKISKTIFVNYSNAMEVELQQNSNAPLNKNKKLIIKPRIKEAKNVMEIDWNRQDTRFPAMQFSIEIKGKEDFDLSIFDNLFQKVNDLSKRQNAKYPFQLDLKIDLSNKVIYFDKLYNHSNLKNIDFMRELHQVLREHFPRFKTVAPTVHGPGFLIRFAQLYSAKVSSVAVSLGTIAESNNLEASILDGKITVENMISKIRQRKTKSDKLPYNISLISLEGRIPSSNFLDLSMYTSS